MFNEVLGTFGLSKATATNALLSADYLVLGAMGLGYATAGEQGEVILGMTLAAVTSAGLLAWLAAYKRYRLIADTPTSQIMSAAQGYVELVGRCEPHSSHSLIGFGPIPGWSGFSIRCSSAAAASGDTWRAAPATILS